MIHFVDRPQNACGMEKILTTAVMHLTHVNRADGVCSIDGQ